MCTGARAVNTVEKNHTKYTSLKKALKFYLAEKLLETTSEQRKKFINHAWHVYKFFEKTVCEGLWSDYLSLYSHLSRIAFLPLGSNHIALFVILWSCMK